jgi:MOSC domain-containing protein YiiM
MGLEGTLAGIARRVASRAPMELLDAIDVSTSAGLVGDCKGLKFRKRQVTVLAAEAWAAACAAVGADLPWTARRANLLTRNVVLPRARGARLRIGGLLLEVTGQTFPCRRMDEVKPGLLKALAPDWRGGLTCTVLAGSAIGLGDPVEILSSPQAELPLPLPG